MHKIVEKKILPKYFDAVIHDKKKYRTRGRQNIVYILRNVPEYGLMPGYVIFGW